MSDSTVALRPLCSMFQAMGRDRSAARSGSGSGHSWTGLPAVITSPPSASSSLPSTASAALTASRNPPRRRSRRRPRHLQGLRRRPPSHQLAQRRRAHRRQRWQLRPCGRRYFATEAGFGLWRADDQRG
ncbi:hypothetical protein KSP40_PGU022274 [Platanthera guangdongensis]|uniref:Uncharacterized protein n=1 Tax=Platanthera guangdongensis TaxID=2320717 RepID=A0ABR2MLF0_9ASPA